MTEPTRHEVPLEPGSHPGRRTGEGSASIVPHLQQQVQVRLPADLKRDDLDSPEEKEL